MAFTSQQNAKVEGPPLEFETQSRHMAASVDLKRESSPWDSLTKYSLPYEAATRAIDPGFAAAHNSFFF